MKIIKNKDRYILPSTLNQCFKRGELVHVDKVFTGNGFTTSFLRELPPNKKINILIAPNKAVVIGKRNSYQFNSILYNGGRCKFFYQESTDVDFTNADTLVFVADSFLLYEQKIKEISHRINRVLIDEYHSTIIQSTYRHNLINFTDKVRSIVGKEPAITTVTATPLLFQKVDIKIKNSYSNPLTIDLVNNQNKAIEEAKKLIKEGKNVLIATNSVNTIHKLKDEKGIVKATWHVGNTFMRSICELVKVKENAESNLTIISSRGFEGVDVYGTNYHVYFFEDRANKHECFYLANLYQAINRCRDSIKTIKYIRLDLNSQRKINFANLQKSIERFVSRTDISTEKKQSRTYRDYHPFVVFEQYPNSHKFYISVNYDAINLYKERLLWDNPFNQDFKEFLEEREISINDLRNYVPTRFKKVQVRNSKKVSNLDANSEVIEKRKLYDTDYLLSVGYEVTKKNALKDLNTWLRRKNYNGQYKLSSAQKNALTLLENDKVYQKHKSKIITLYRRDKIKTNSRTQTSEKVAEFENNLDRIFISLIIAFANEKPYFTKKIIGNRDYNLLTEVSISVLDYVSSLFLYDAYEFDIRTCNARIIYAILGLTLPSDFYGKDKINKVSINVHLNNFMLNVNKGTLYKVQEHRAKEKFTELGFNDKVTSYLMQNFFDTGYRDSVFNFFAYHEAQIIASLKRQFKAIGVKGTRRHDSLIVFKQKTDTSYQLTELEQLVKDFSYLNIEGWFTECELEIKV